MKISVSVMAHPDRAAQVDALKKELGYPIRVAFDMSGPPSRDPERIWDTARRAWGMHDHDADWHLLLQDDAIVATNLLDELPRALQYVPERAVVSLYVGGGRPMSTSWAKAAAEADRINASWIVASRALWGVALILPRVLIAPMMEYGNRQRGIPDDMRVNRWAARERIPVWYTWPCLVNHPNEGSLAGHGNGRMARSFIDNARDASWSGPAITWRGV